MKKLKNLIQYFALLMLFLLVRTASLVGQEGPERALVQPKSVPVITEALEEVRSQSPAEWLDVWVFFTDKGIFSEDQLARALQTAESRLLDRARRRRAKVRTDKLVDFLDLPVRDEYRQAILSVGVKHRTTTRWFNGISVSATPDQIMHIAQFPFVRSIQLVKKGRRSPVPDGWDYEKLSPQEVQTDYGYSYDQLQQINVPAVHEMELHGEGVLICILDTGYYKDHECFQAMIIEDRLIAEWDFINNDGETQNEDGDYTSQHNHGTYTLSTLGGQRDSVLYGPAYGADFLLAKTEDITSETPVEEDYFVAALEWADSLGAEVASSSLGYIDWYTYEDMDGNTAITTIGCDIAAHNGILVCTAAGNEGPLPWPGIIAPADGYSVIAVGAVDGSGYIAGFSSWGPTYDGRTKPEVLARGVGTFCATTTDPSSYRTASGTSLSTPLVAGCAALILQAHPDWTPFQVREALMMTADNADNPDNHYGWGVVDVLAAIYYTPSAPDTAHVSVPNASASPGDTVAVPVVVGDLTELDVRTAHFILSFDGSILTALSAGLDDSTIPPSAVWDVVYNTSQEHISVTMAGGDSLTGGGNLVKITFLIVDSCQANQTSPLHFETFVFNGGNPSAVTEDGLFTCVVVGISDQGRNEFSPKSFTLFQNVPNPFNATTIIRYRLPEKAKVTLWIYNLRGQRVSSLVNNVQNPGDYRIQWDARDLPSGVYFARLQANQFISIRKILLIK